MRTFSQLLNLSTTLTQNTSAANQSLMTTLLTEQHRLLVENYFDNERQFSVPTVGAETLALTATPAAGDTSATLTSVWTHASGQQMVYFTSSTETLVQFTNGSATITWQEPLVDAATNDTPSTGGFGKYRMPAGISKITNATITVGQMRFTMQPVQTRTEWDNVNFLPYPSDIPVYAFIYGGYMEVWPIPSTTGNMLTFNYKTRVPDFSTAYVFSDTSGAAYVAGQTTYDYQKGTIATAPLNGVSITGTSTSWNTTGKFPLNTDLSQQNLALRIDPPNGDGLWYPIQQFTSDTALILDMPIQNIYNASGATYSIGQIPVLSEDFHEMVAYGAIKIYYSTINPDPNGFKQFEGLYAERMEALEAYAGTKQVNYNLGDRPALLNPNNYPFSPGNVQAP